MLNMVYWINVLKYRMVKNNLSEEENAALTQFKKQLANTDDPD